MCVPSLISRRSSVNDHKTDHLAAMEIAHTASEDMWRKWVFSLAVGNGAGLLAVGAALLQPNAGAMISTAMLVNSGWLFMSGVLAAALIIRFRATAHHWAAVYNLEAAFDPPDPQLAVELEETIVSRRITGRPGRSVSYAADRTLLPRRATIVACRLLEVVAAGSFVAALSRPLIALSGF